MSYKDKVLKKRLFMQSLIVLRDFACNEPKLPLDNRRAIVSSISLGGSLASRYKQLKMFPYYHLNYQYTRQGLLRSCLDKIISSSEKAQEVKKAICMISSLSAWAKSNPNWSKNIFDDFTKQIVPEDFSEKTESLTGVNAGLKRRFGNDITLDLITLSGNSFYKKYKAR